MTAFLHALEEAQAMAKAGNVGAELDDLLLHANELLDIIDDELLQLDRRENTQLFEAASTLRDTLEQLRDELRGGMAH